MEVLLTGGGVLIAREKFVVTGPFLTIIVGGANAPPVPLGGTKISNNKNAYRQIC